MVHFWERAWAPPLTPVCLTPHRSSSAVEPIGVLEKIDHVEITNFAEIGGVVYYYLHVYLKHHTNRIPTNKRLEAARRDEPDYTIQKRFNDFANLRYQVWSYAQRQHDGGAACKYCSKNMDFLVTSFRSRGCSSSCSSRARKLAVGCWQRASTSTSNWPSAGSRSRASATTRATAI